MDGLNNFPYTDVIHGSVSPEEVVFRLLEVLFYIWVVLAFIVAPLISWGGLALKYLWNGIYIHCGPKFTPPTTVDGNVLKVPVYPVSYYGRVHRGRATGESTWKWMRKGSWLFVRFMINPIWVTCELARLPRYSSIPWRNLEKVLNAKGTPIGFVFRPGLFSRQVRIRVDWIEGSGLVQQPRTEEFTLSSRRKGLRRDLEVQQTYALGIKSS